MCTRIAQTPTVVAVKEGIAAAARKRENPGVETPSVESVRLAIDHELEMARSLVEDLSVDDDAQLISGETRIGPVMKIFNESRMNAA